MSMAPEKAFRLNFSFYVTIFFFENIVQLRKAYVFDYVS